MTTYSAGTASINNNETAVTGQGTAWQTNSLKAGDLFMAAGQSVPIASVNSNTSLTLQRPWPAANRAAAVYDVLYIPDNSRLTAIGAELLAAMQSSALSALKGVTPAADRLAYFNGAGSAALTPLTTAGRALLDDADASAMLTTLGVSTFVKSLLDDTSAAAFLATLGADAAIHKTGPLFNLLEDGGRFAGSPEAQAAEAGAFAAPGYISPYNGAAIAAGGKFTTNNSSYGGAAAALPTLINELETKIHSVAAERRYGIEYYALEITPGSGTGAAPFSGHYLCLLTSYVASPPVQTTGAWVRCTVGSMAVGVEDGAVWVDGVKYDTPQIIVPADGWKFVGWRRTSNTLVGYDNSMMTIYGQNASKIYLAMPWTFPGLYPLDGFLTPAPVPSLRIYR